MAIFTISKGKITVGNVADMEDYFDSEVTEKTSANIADNIESDTFVSGNKLGLVSGGMDDYFTAPILKNSHALYNGSFAFGMAETIQKGDYSKLMLGYNPRTGEDLLSKNRRKQINKANAINELIKKKGIDAASELYTEKEITDSKETVLGISTAFNVDKSISLLYAKANNDIQARIENALMTANAQALAYAESRGYFRTRVGAKGAQAVPGQAAIASFLHFSSRELDPQLHIHNEIANFVQFKDPETGEWRTNTLDASQVYKRQKELASIFDTALQQELGALGFSDYLAVDFDGYGLQAKGFSDEAIQNASKRRQEILAYLKESGGAGHGAAQDVAALATRTAKKEGDISSEELRELWRAGLTGEGLKKVTEEEREAAQAFTKLQLEKKLFNTGSVFTQYDLDRAASHLNLALGRTLSDLDLTRDELKNAMGVIDCGTLGETESKKVQYFTTEEMLGLESDLVRYAHSAANVENPAFVLDAEQIQQALEQVQAEKGWQLREEQVEALRHAATGHRLALIQGAAGTGKSVSMEVLNRVYTEAGNRVIGLAPSGAAAASLEESSGIASQTVHSLLIRIESGKEPDVLKAGDVIVVDEAGMLDTRTLHKLAGYAEKYGAKMVLVGDSLQLEAVGSAGLFGTLQDTAGKVEIKQIARQKKAEMSAISQAWYDGAPGEAVKLMQAGDDGRPLIVNKYGETAARDALLDRYKNLLAEGNNPKQILMLADSNADVDSLNLSGRELYAKSGAIDPEKSIVFKSKINRTAPEKILEFAPGERVMLRENSKSTADEKQIYNGDQGTFEGISEKGSYLVKLDRTGETVEIDKDYQAISYAYAMTVHKSQGLTVDHALYLPSQGTNRRAAYVAFTRSRAGAEFFIGGPIDSEKDEDEAFNNFLENTNNYETKKTALDATAGAYESIVSAAPEATTTFNVQQASALEILELQGELLELGKQHEPKINPVITGQQQEIQKQPVSIADPEIVVPPVAVTTNQNQNPKKEVKLMKESKKALPGQCSLEAIAGVSPDDIIMHKGKILFPGMDGGNIKGALMLNASTLEPVEGQGVSSVFKIEGKGENSGIAVICSSPLEALVRKSNDNAAGENGRTYLAPLEPSGNNDFRKNTAWEREIAAGGYEKIINSLAHDADGKRQASYVQARLEAQGKTAFRSWPAVPAGMSGGEIAVAQNANAEELQYRVAIEKQGLERLSKPVVQLSLEVSKIIKAAAEVGLHERFLILRNRRLKEIEEAEKAAEARISAEKVKPEAETGSDWVEIKPDDQEQDQQQDKQQSRGRSL